MSLASVTIFNGMSGDNLNRLTNGATFLETRDGTTIFEQGDPADAVFSVVAGDGQVRVGVVDHRSKALMVEVFRTGEIYGEIGVIDGGSRTASAVVRGNVRLAKIRAAAFLDALSHSPELGDALLIIAAIGEMLKIRLPGDETELVQILLQIIDLGIANSDP